ncbi:MAG: hypothetical protein H6708_08770, partial [Kofleriaceae bacterium]|nr:hypothetical protein [Kofleriaceae bacterium]
MNRTAGAAALTAVLLTALLASWFSGGWRAVRAEQRTLRAAPRLAAERTAREVADELAARLDQLRRREDARPYYHYQNLFHDPRGAAVGAAVTPSPLAAGPDDPLVAAHFQIDAAGAVTLPTLNEDVPELNAPDLADNRAMRDALASVAPSLRPDDGPGGVAIAALEPSALGNADPIQQVQQGGVAQRPRVEVLDQDAYLQNTYSQQVYQNARAGQVVAPEQLPVQQAERGGAPTGKVARRDAARDRVAVTVAPLAWRRVEVAGAPALVAVRRVDTPDGPLTQGL